MKKLIAIPIAVLACAGAYAQGTVGYANNSNARVAEAPSLGGTKTTVTSTSGVNVELFYQVDSGGAAPAAITSSGALGNWLATSITGIISLGGGGLFSGPNLTLSQATGGGNVWIDVVGWDGSQTSLSAALAGGSSFFGSSAVFANATGNPGGTPPTVPVSIAANFATAGGLTLTPLSPEPTTIALGALGAASLLAFRRKK